MGPHRSSDPKARCVLFLLAARELGMSEHSITMILNQLREAVSEDERDAAAAELYRCYRGPVERIARGRLTTGGGLSDEEDVAQSAFRSFFGRIQTGQLDSLVSGGQAWAILARLTRNKAIDSVRYDNALCRGGGGARRNQVASDNPAVSDTSVEQKVSKVQSPDASPSVTSTESTVPKSTPRSDFFNLNVPKNRLGIGDPAPTSTKSGSRREEYPLEAVRDAKQRSAEDEAISQEVVELFLEQLSEATLRGIVSMKLHGFTNEEIAEKIGCATRTVERKLGLIRRLWDPILEQADESLDG